MAVGGVEQLTLRFVARYQRAITIRVV